MSIMTMTNFSPTSFPSSWRPTSPRHQGLGRFGGQIEGCRGGGVVVQGHEDVVVKRQVSFFLGFKNFSGLTFFGGGALQMLVPHF